MSTRDKRTHPRKKVCVQAFAADAEDTFDVKCMIRDASQGGCMIVSSNISELPEYIQLIPEGFDTPLEGKIVWRGEKFAGISFISSNAKKTVREVEEFFVNVKNSDEKGVLELNGFVRPLGYSDRLARYRSKMK